MKTLNLMPFTRKVAVIGLTSLLLIACGSDNKTNSNNHGPNLPPTNSPTPDLPPASDMPGNVESDMSYLKQNYQCEQGQRMPDIRMSVTQFTNSNTTIQGQFQSGFVEGRHSASYAGANYGTRDLIFVTKVSDGSGNVAFNFTLSLCPQKNAGSGADIIGPNTQYQSMEMIQGFTLDHDVACALGNVDVGGIRFQTDSHPTPHQRLFSKVCSR